MNNEDFLKNISNIDKKIKRNDKDYYMKKNNFSELFQKYQQPPIKLIQKNYNNQFTSKNSQTPLTRRTTNMANRWSPKSSAGNIYEWNRGVIGIAQDGTTIKENLDGTINHHADATARIGRTLGYNINEEMLPFAAALECTENGLLIFQSEGNQAYVYFPDSISDDQLKELEKIITPRDMFEFSYSCNNGDLIEEEQKFQDVLNFANSIVRRNTARK